MLAGSLQVNAGSGISADAQGYASYQGPGGANDIYIGGAHGGRGSGNPASPYDSYLAPMDLGSGGGPWGASWGDGGGAIRLIVSGTLANHGTISANGTSGGNSGGGAGGSIWVTTGTLAGAGTFMANGAGGSGGVTAGGGGGRVAIYYTVDGGFNRAAVTASAGAASATAGSVYLLENGAHLRVPTALALPPDTNASYANVTVENGATFTLGGGSTLTVIVAVLVTGNATILVQGKNTTGLVEGQWRGAGSTIAAASLQVDAGSRISADAQGYASNRGPGGANDIYIGGTHGGRGSGNAASPYGSYLAPTDLGSGGGPWGGSWGDGGGAIRLSVSGTLTNHGTISANGTSGGNSGGGAGGSIWVSAGTLGGAGTFMANGAGGSGGVTAGGGGGRVAIYYTVDGGFNRATVTASAGTASATAGSVYLLESGAHLRVPTALALPPDTSATFASVTVENGATFTLGGGSTLTVTGAVLMTGNATILVQGKNTTGLVGEQWLGAGATIHAGSLQVNAGSRISADAQGYATYQGPGGANGLYIGGTHGGRGSGNPASPYGSVLMPTDLGSGGGSWGGGWGEGGGAIRLVVSGPLTNHGTISANGTSGGNSGGGAGGSIWVTTGALAGAGTFTANGAGGSGGVTAGGGGGRVAIYYGSSTFNRAAITAASGGGTATSGTVALVVSPPVLSSVLPAQGPVGATVLLTGTGFTWATEVRFNATIQPAFTIAGDIQITTTVPAGATTGSIQVVTAGGVATSAASFVVIPPPTLTSVAPARGGVGATVTLTGTGLTWATQVVFNGTEQPAFTVVSDTSITTTVPAGAATGPVQVVNAAGTATFAGGFTVIIDTDLDTLTDEWEAQFGLNPSSGAGDDGVNGDPDHDGLTNLQEFEGGTHPRGFFTRYLAEGALNAFFDVRLALLNVGTDSARVLTRFLQPGGAILTRVEVLAAGHRRTITRTDLAALVSPDFSTVVESDQQVVVDRTMSWDASGYGAHAESSVASPATTWYLAEGSTSADFALFYLLQNPNPTSTTATVRYLRPLGQTPIERTYVLAPSSRTTIPVDEQGPELASTDLSAVITAPQPIIVERAMYMSRPGQAFAAGHGSAGVTAPATSWFLAEGATGPFFDLFILLANPNDQSAQVTVDYLLLGGTTYTKSYSVPANGRFTIWVDDEQIPAGSGTRPLDNVAVSSTITSTNGMPIIVERAMWWPSPVLGPAFWMEAHNSPGATTTATRWAMAEGEVGGPQTVETYILIANTSAGPGTARVTLHFEDGTSVDRAFALLPRSRTNVSVSVEFPAAAGRRFGAVVESLGAAPAQIVVERAMYWDALGQTWAAGTNALATRLP